MYLNNNYTTQIRAKQQRPESSATSWPSMSHYPFSPYHTSIEGENCRGRINQNRSNKRRLLLSSNHYCSKANDVQGVELFDYIIKEKLANYLTDILEDSKDLTCCSNINKRITSLQQSFNLNVKRFIVDLSVGLVKMIL